MSRKVACGGFRPPSADDMHVFWGGPRKGEPITNEDMEMFEMAMGRMSCDGVSVDAQYDADKEADNPYSDDILGDDKFDPEQMRDPNVSMVQGMPHGPWSLGFKRLVWGMPLSNTGADPIGKWITGLDMIDGGGVRPGFVPEEMENIPCID